MDKLLDGMFDSQIAQYHIIDCRFDYEYNGGHIPGATNINTPSGVEDFLLDSAINKPKQSLSGDPAKKTILIFHCEFSVKRAPTLYVLFSSVFRALLIIQPFQCQTLAFQRQGYEQPRVPQDPLPRGIHP